MKHVVRIQQGPPRHWVGDGFPVRSIFAPQETAEELSPFLLLDYAAPIRFEPARMRRGVGEHPHRGFETVTVVYQGEIEHRDSAGHSGLIGPGDVQWMTAAAGVVHEEKHSQRFTESGGQMEMVQLWVNLPAQYKMTPPRYQTLLDAQIPSITLPDDAGKVRVIAGEVLGTKGPAQTFSPIHLLDVRLKKNADLTLPLIEGFSTAVFVLDGELRVNQHHTARSAELAVLSRQGTDVIFNALNDVKALVLCGEPILEPITTYGPFVMNTDAEIRQAIQDYQAGKMGRLV